MKLPIQWQSRVHRLQLFSSRFPPSNHHRFSSVIVLPGLSFRTRSISLRRQPNAQTLGVQIGDTYHSGLRQVAAYLWSADCCQPASRAALAASATLNRIRLQPFVMQTRQAAGRPLVRGPARLTHPTCLRSELKVDKNSGRQKRW
jgi:hypothetical protein